MDKFYSSLKSVLGTRYAEVSFELDCCLHLPEDRFFFHLPNRNNSLMVSALRFSDVKKKQDHRHGSATGFEVITDSNAAFRFSRIHVYFPVDAKDQRENILNIYAKEVISMTNYFLDVYRYVTKRYAIQRIVILTDKPYLETNIHDENDNSNVSPVTYFGFGGLLKGEDGSLTNFLPDRSGKEVDEIFLMVKDGKLVHSAQLLLMNSSRLIREGYSYLALANMSSALEAVVYDLYNNYLSKLTVPSDIQKSFTKGGHLFKKIKWSINELNNKVKIQFNQNEIAKLEKLIKDRNDYIHENKENLSYSILEYQEIVEKYLDLLSISQSPKT